MRYQEKVSTRADVRSLYGRVKEQPAISHYRGYTATKSYGWDEEAGDYIKADGEMWFENPYYDPDFFTTHNDETKPEDVMRALECWVNHKPCEEECPIMEYEGSHNCMMLTMKNALALLREKDALLAEWDAKCNNYETALMGKDAEIERLRKAKYIYSTVDYCADDLAKAREKNERLKADNKDLVDLCHLLNHSLEEERAIVIDEFAERLKAKLIAGGIYPVIVKNAIDQIAKGMKGAGATHGE